MDIHPTSRINEDLGLDSLERVELIMKIERQKEKLETKTMAKMMLTKYEFDTYRAVGVAEGFEETSGLEETLAAWQYLIDNDLCWSLQGWFGRTAQQLIDEELCHAKEH